MEKTIENVEEVLTDHVEDLTQSREKLMGLKSVLNENLEIIRKLGELIPESVKGKDIENEIEDSDELVTKITIF